MTRNYSHMCACAVYSIHGYYLRAVFISLRAPDCAATIQRNTVVCCRKALVGTGWAISVL